MNITDYASLQAGVADWLNRADLSARLPDFIGLAEARIMRRLNMRLLESEKPLTGTIGSRTISLPSDYSEPLNFWWNNGVDREPMRFVPPDLIDVFTNQTRPLQWTIDQGNIAFETPCDQAYSFVFRYRQQLALSDDAPTNVVLTQWPELYLFAACAEASRYLKDRQAALDWDAKWDAAIDEINTQEGRSRTLTTMSVEPALLVWKRGRGGFNVYLGY